MMTRSRREQQREKTTTEIKDVARQQMAEVGAAALSLRAIAREMGLSAPALYRYFSNRDALVTTLIIEAYTALGDALIAADTEKARTDYYGRFQAVALAFRTWAVGHPQDFTLIYGTPIPGYYAPAEQTVAPASRIMETIGRVLTEAWLAQKMTIPDTYQHAPPALQTVVDEILAHLEERISGAVIILTMTIWGRLYGIVWGELYGHFVPGMAESGELYHLEVNAICATLCLHSS